MQVSDCIIWPHAKQADGYGIKRNGLAHRELWKKKHGPIPNDIVLHHICGTKACVNFDHLKPMVQPDHVAHHNRKAPVKTHCKYGHPLVRVSVPKRRTRCPECIRRWGREAYWRRVKRAKK